MTANWICRRSIIEQVGGFRSELKSGGDFELTRRIGKAGHRIVYDPAVLVYHPARATLAELVGKSRRVIGGRMMAHPERRNPVSWWAGLAIDSARRLQTIFKARHLQLRMKIQLVLLVLALLAASSLEVLFLTFGAEPRRA